MSRPVVLIIRDGWGTNPHVEHDAFNAVKLAKTPVAQRLMAEWPTTHVITCGEDVGLPGGPPPTMGNSEVGHQNIGAGRIVDQELMRITRAIRDGTFFSRPAFLNAIKHARDSNSNLHLLGLLSNGLVHSDIEHLYALLDLIKKSEFPGERVFIHVITDGRDVGPTTGLGFVRDLEARLAKWHLSPERRPRIASVCGRYFAMDRDHRWERVARAYALLTGRRASHPLLQAEESRPLTALSASDAIQRYYDHPAEPSRSGDEFITPTQIVNPKNGRPLAGVTDSDAVIFFNYRGDRPRELVKAFMLDDAAWKCVPNALKECGGFDRGKMISNLFFATMSAYEQGLPISAVAFDKPPKMPAILGEVVSKAEGGLSQFRCAETEKFPHVTFFFNDYREEPFPGENRELIQSPKDVTTYDQKPQMSAAGVCDAVLRRLNAADCEALIVVNFANPDMVGHTGKLDAAIKAVETVDACVGRIIDATLARGGSAIVMADHGNAEQMWDPVHHCPHTAHTVYDVPVIVVGAAYKGSKLRSGGRLADIAPTVLAMMGIPRPAEMTGRSLLESSPGSRV